MNVAQMTIPGSERLCRPKGAEAEQTAATAVSFDHSETRRTGGRGVNTQYAIWLCSHANGGAATQFMAAGRSLARLFSSPSKEMLTAWRSRLAGHDGHFFFVDVEVGEDVLYVVVLFERFHEFQHLLRRRTRQLDVILRNPGDLRRFRLDACFRQCFSHVLESVGRSEHLPGRAIVAQVLRPGIENDRKHLVLASLFFGNHDLAFAAEHPAYGARLSQIPAVAAHHVPNLADHAVAVGGDHLHDHSHPSRTITLEVYFLVLFPFELAGSALYGSFDILIGHV